MALLIVGAMELRALERVSLKDAGPPSLHVALTRAGLGAALTVGSSETLAAAFDATG